MEITYLSAWHLLVDDLGDANRKAIVAIHILSIAFLGGRE